MSATDLTPKIYHIAIGTPFGDQVFKISAKTQHAATVTARRAALRADHRLTDDHLTTHHLGFEEWDSDRLEIIRLAHDTYHCKLVPTDIDGTPGNLTIDGVDPVEWLEMLFA